DESRRRISLSVKRAESQNLPLRDLMPPELTGETQSEATPEEVPDLDVSEEVFPEPPPAESAEAEAPAEEPDAAEESATPEDAGTVATVFDAPDELPWLESVLHRRVGDRVLRRRHSLPDGAQLAVVEVPLLFETGMDAAFDATVAVVAEDGKRADRAGARGTELLDGRSNRQLSQEEKAARATHVIRN